MAYQGLVNFIESLEKDNELQRIKSFCDPVLEIAEITDRITKAGNGKALLFENNGTTFPLLINIFGSEHRSSMAIGRNNPAAAGEEIEKIFNALTVNSYSIFRKISLFPWLVKLAGFMPSRSRKKGLCQEVIHPDPDLSILPVLKCWPFDGGRFITLPMVHTVHPETGNSNVGMYRMQILDRKTTGMHWQRHKTGANHFEAWKKAGRIMPVSVALGGDPVYTYSATAPLPENVSEYILAGFLRKKKVKLVKCITNNIYVPSDADIIIEGYVDPSEEFVKEGPFGDHTGFYSLADMYPKFHVTCITHSKKAVYPATIVGIPPQEDSLLANITENLFLTPVKLALLPEIEDFHLPDAGVAHNLLIVKIKKTYPGQGMKVINSLSGAGQMMFSKYMIVVSGDTDIRNYRKLMVHILENADLTRNFIFGRGPLDVLDHSSDSFSFGGKAGLDATIKYPEEKYGRTETVSGGEIPLQKITGILSEIPDIKSFNTDLLKQNIPVVIISLNPSADNETVERTKHFLRKNNVTEGIRLIIAVDHTVDINDLFMVSWQLLGNSDPLRDHDFLHDQTLFIDATIKAFRKGGFPRKWPNVVCSGEETINIIDQKWGSLGIGSLIVSPSLKYKALCREGKDEIII